MVTKKKGAGALTVTMPSDREVVMTRVFDAPRRLVFEAWTKPEHVVHFLGPYGSTMVECEIDLRAGGTYRYVIRHRGKDTGMRGVYREIVRPERLVVVEGFDDFPDQESFITATFTEEDGQTTLTSHILYASVEARDAVVHMGMADGAGQMFDRLAEHLRTMLRPQPTNPASP
ncbi:MAG: hypothetical protein JWM74_1202 [Myxococcaceae bacterium]|jgi:uncharacterized protein YndB with AHSA1/START domain|nr:hypothetical protein [Myxococcaceae bacterium]